MPTTRTPQVRFLTIDGVRIRYADSGGSHGPTVMLTSPWPESLYAFAPLWTSLGELLPNIATPVTIVNGRHDRVVPLANAEFLHQRLPTSRLQIIEAGHFVWEEAPTEYAAIILDSVTGNWP